jgi:hypothetical protein
MKTSAGIRCDGCAKIEDRTWKTSDRRPAPDSRDRFFDFVIPPSISPITGKPDGKFRGIGMESDPRMPIPLHACPACAKLLPKALKFTIKRMIVEPQAGMKIAVEAVQLDGVFDMSILPAGPLREALEPAVARGAIQKIGRA